MPSSESGDFPIRCWHSCYNIEPRAPESGGRRRTGNAKNRKAALFRTCDWQPDDAPSCGNLWIGSRPIRGSPASPPLPPSIAESNATPELPKVPRAFRPKGTPIPETLTARGTCTQVSLCTSTRCGRPIWRRWSGDRCRRRVETKMYSVTLLVPRRMARDFDRQVADVQVGAAVLNGFTASADPSRKPWNEPRAGLGKVRRSLDLRKRALGLRSSLGFARGHEIL